MHYVRRHRPHLIIFENVPAYRKSKSAHAIRRILETSGYEFTEYCFEANRDFATPARRSRWVLVASRIGRFDWSYQPQSYGGTIGDVLDADVSTDKTFSPAQCEAHAAYCERKRSEGCGWRRVIVERSDTSVPTLVRTYHKTHASGPFVRCHDTYRKFRSREIARLNGLPDTFPLPCSEREAVEILGQGVSFRPFESLGKALGLWLRTGRCAPPVHPDGQLGLL